MKKTLSRRVLVAGSAALVAAPLTLAGSAFAASPSAQTTTPIAKLWAEAQTLGSQLTSFRSSIAEAATRAGDGVPGWMRLGGQANAIAEARYGKLVAILNTPAKTAGDLAIIGKVSIDSDITSGARAWASERLAAASIQLAA